MDIKLFFSGAAFLLASFLLYYYLKRQKPSSEATNWNGPILPQYVKGWGIAILCFILGVAFILKSFPD
jgi:hypothetical protein